MNARPNQKRAIARPMAGRAGARTCRPGTSALIAEMAVGGVDYLRNAIALQKAVIDAIPATVALLDEDGIIVAVNEGWKAFARENGYRGDDFGVGSSYLGVCGEDDGGDDDDAAGGVSDVLSGKIPIYVLEYPCHAPDQQRWFNLMVKPLEAEAFRGAIVFHINITERKLAEIAAHEARDSALAANKSKDLFIASATHEFRTPLTSIMGFAEMAQRAAKKKNVDQQALCVDEIRTSSEHLLGLVNDLLDLSEAQVGDFSIDDRPVDLNETVETALRMVTPQADKGGIALDLTTSDRLPRLRADAKRLSQIVLNLLSNAIKFTPEGGRVGVEARLDADDALVLCVTDSGVGIPQEDIAQVLEPFGKSDHECERNPNGTGLGLPMVKRLVEGHGGAFRLESAVGEGTTATVMFPNYRVVR